MVEEQELKMKTQDGPISGDGGDCQEDFVCCRWQGPSFPASENRI